MVECESRNPNDPLSKVSVLIDTWWNVNIFTKADSAKQYMF